MGARSCFMLFLIILISATTLVPLYASLSSIENDRMALLDLRDGFLGDTTSSNVSVLNSWNSSLHICDWKGIQCGKKHKRVTIIYLAEQKLNGIISPSIGNLSFLRLLYLNNNSLYGEIPRQIGNLQRLRILDLHVNSFQGRIPTELSNCSSLLYINLANNDLTGQIPFQLGSLTKMLVFTVSKNYLMGEMPTFFRNFSSLIAISIGNNNLHGEIRDSLNGLVNLSFLQLDYNNFTGIVSPVYNLSSLATLQLNGNNFTGTLAQDIDIVLPKLKWLSIAYNNFFGVIPPALFNISGLSVIQMSFNKFRGHVPDNIGYLKSLRILNIAENNLGGSDKSNDLRFFDSLTNCTNLEMLSLGGNKFTGPIPNSVKDLSSNIRQLEMRNNYITGVIPNGMNLLSGLTILDLSENLLTGTIPDSIGKLLNVSVLVLSANKLHGEIPSSLGNLTYLYKLNLSRNSLDGNVPTILRNCKGMQEIDVSSNNFDGYLPDEVFDQWGQLVYCNLSHNSFDGKFPSVGKFRSLNTLDASYNNFNGEIPAQLSESLEFLSLAGNSFQGNIPASLGKLRGLNWLDLSSNNLSGPVTKELASLVLLRNLNLSFNRLEGEVPLFENITGVSVTGNRKLCGGNLELYLRPCREKTRKAISKKVVIVATVCPFALLSLLILSLIFFYRQRKYKREDAYGLAERYQRITYAELFKATNGFSESNLIGTGSFGDVFKGNIDGNENEPVAVKVLKLSKHGATKSFNAECKVLRSIRHRNLLKIITSCSSLDHKGNDFKALVFEYMSNGNLDSWLHTNHDQGRAYLTLAKRLQIALDVACALDYLHNNCEPPIVHCDLKPSNILLDDDMVAHIGDFGLSKLLHGVRENMNGEESLSAAIRGTVGYVAPEYGMGATISPQGDIFSYGVLLLELITGRRPTNEMFNSEMSLQNFIERALPENIEEVVDECLVKELHEATAIHRNPEQYKLQWHIFLVSFVEIGISCSAKSSKDRMDIQSVIKCLTSIKEKCSIICQV